MWLSSLSAVSQRPIHSRFSKFDGTSTHYFLLQKWRRNEAAAVEDAKKKEELVKASFRVRKSNLMSIAP